MRQTETKPTASPIPSIAELDRHIRIAVGMTADWVLASRLRRMWKERSAEFSLISGAAIATNLTNSNSTGDERSEQSDKTTRVGCLAFGMAVALASCISTGPEPQTATTLCRALVTIDPGDIMPVVVSGIYKAGYEFSELFDPDQPQCARDVQPATWVEFGKGVESLELARMLGAHGRARVTFSGNLYGPGEVKPDDPALPFAAALAERIEGQRYGHLNAFRTKLVVLSVVEVSAPSEADPWQWTGEYQGSEPPPAVPERLGLPSYPVTARKLGVAGLVRIRVAVEDGKVVTAEVLSGDRLLAPDAAESVETWMFAPGTTTEFTTTFVYELEWLTPPAPRAVVLFDLPALVKITGARSGW